MHTARGEHDPLDLEIIVDPEAEPRNWDEALAAFLLALVRKRTSTSDATSALTEPNDNEK